MEYHLDLTEGLLAVMDAEGQAMVCARAGVEARVYAVRWADGGSIREGFASANTAADARRIVLAHEHGYHRAAGLTPRHVTARMWGTREDLSAWAMARCGR